MRLVSIEGAAGLLQGFVILVDDHGRVTEEKPGTALCWTLLRPEDQPFRGVPNEPEEYTAPQRLQAANSNMAAEQVPHFSRRESDTCGPALDKQVYAPSLARGKQVERGPTGRVIPCCLEAGCGRDKSCQRPALV